MKSCWICGAPADTGEHKLKRSLLVAVHGDGPYQGNSEMAHCRAGRFTPLRGPNADQIKYQNVLCARCNNSDTQPFDAAFDKFCGYLLAYEDSVVAGRIIDFEDVYGKAFATEQLNLFKYFAKLFGCALAASGQGVPEDVRFLLSQQQFLTKLFVTFAINEDKFLLPNASWRPLGFRDLVTTRPNLRTKDDPHYIWGLHISCVEVLVWYDWIAEGRYGSPWIANSRYIYFGRLRPLDTATRLAGFDRIAFYQLRELQQRCDFKATSGAAA